MWFVKSKSRRKQAEPWPLFQMLLHWNGKDAWSIGDACQGTAVFGATGSGKTTGSGQAIARAFLRAGFGGLVLTAKPGDRANFEDYCRREGRLNDVALFDASAAHRYSFLDEELNRKGSGAGLTENIVNLFSTVLEIAERNSGQGGREDEGYWMRALRQLCRNLVDLLVLARGRVTIPELYRVGVSAATGFEQIRSDEWKKQSFCFQCLADADGKAKSPRQQRDFELVADYFMQEFPGLSDKTRSVVLSTFTSMVDVLNRGILRDLFSSETTIRPEDAFDGRIIIVDLPVKEFAEVGQFAQVLWKYCFQKVAERRDIAANNRPVFLWADEFQLFSTSHDALFQTTARSARVATVYLTQNYSNLLAAFGGEQSRADTDSLVGNLQTKVLHGNGDPVTNEWAASLIGRTRQFFMNMNSSFEPADAWSQLMGLHEDPRTSAGMSEQMEFEVQPRVFTSLRTGGPANRWCVEGLVFQGGRVFETTGTTWLKVTFDQQKGRPAI